MTKKQSTTTPSLSKTVVFYSVALLIPFLFFGILEVGLRLVGYGKDTPLFIENPSHSSYILPRPDILTRYFPDNDQLPSVTMEANFILTEKPENGFRVIVQGGSTAAGFPYGLGASIAGTLDQRLRQSLPNKYVEVLNTAMSAVNSYTLLDIAEDIIEQQPDAVFVYAGHNEFLGILGVGSQFTVAGSSLSTRAFIALKEWRVFQLFQNIVFGFSSEQPPSSSASGNDSAGTDHASNTYKTESRTFMAKVAKHKDIAINSAMFEAGIEQFERNMQALIAKYEHADVPVFIATIASNLKDQSPFASSEATTKNTNTIVALRQQLQDSSASQARTLLDQVSLSIETSTSANLHYSFAQIAEKNNHMAVAKKHYVAAKDNDLLRFRAPEAINQIIRQLAKQNEHVYLVDAKQALEKRSKHSIVGNNFMLEHLHPNLQGYYVIANTFYETFIKANLTTPVNQVSINTAWQQRLILPQEEYFGYATIKKLRSDYPFTQQPTPVMLSKPADWQQALGQQLYNKRLDWLSMMTQSLDQYRNRDQLDMAYKTLQILADAMPHNGLYNLQIAEVMFKQKRLAESLYYFRRAKLAGAMGNAIDTNITLLESQLGVKE